MLTAHVFHIPMGITKTLKLLNTELQKISHWLLANRLSINVDKSNYALKFSSASHFADDTSIIYTSKNLKMLETNINFDLKSVSLTLFKCGENHAITFQI